MQAAELEQTIEATLGSAESGVENFKGALSRLKERLAATENLRAKLSDFSSSLPWSGGRPLAELAVEAESVRRVAAELQAALGRERQAQATYAESIKRKEARAAKRGLWIDPMPVAPWEWRKAAAAARKLQGTRRGAAAIGGTDARAAGRSGEGGPGVTGLPVVVAGSFCAWRKGWCFCVTLEACR
jgi:hypothetical protein